MRLMATHPVLRGRAVQECLGAVQKLLQLRIYLRRCASYPASGSFIVRTYHPSLVVSAALSILLTLPATGLSAQKLTQEEVIFFESKIRPLLAAHCLECHSAEKGKIKGGLNLDSKPDWSKGGESGAVIAPGNVKESLLARAVSWDGDLQMPPKRMLEKEQIEDLKR